MRPSARAVMATLSTTLESTKGTILRMARECDKHVKLVDCLVDGAFGLDQDQFKARMTEMAATIADQVDVIVFAQGSMAYCEEYIAEKFGKVVLSSPRFGAAELKKALEKKGTIETRLIPAGNAVKSIDTIHLLLFPLP